VSRWPALLAAAVVVAGLATTAAPPVAAATVSTVTFSFAGDTILGNTPQLPRDPARYLAPVAGALRANSDVVFGNLEGDLTNGGTSKCPGGSGGYCYAFRNPPSFARAYAGAGFTMLGLANNHSYDFGSTGLRSTERAIGDAGMRYTGMPGQISYLTRHHIRIAFVAFAPYGRTNNLLDLDNAARLVRRARSHAAIVVVYMHAGAEGSSADHVTGREEHYAGEDRGNPRRFAHLVIDNGASLVVASGPHVLRGIEFYNKRLIDYSLGDFAGYRNFSTAGTLSRSVILHVTLTSRGLFRSAQLTSVRLASDGRAAVGGDAVAFVASLSRHDFAARAARISRSGRVLPP
jgi:poly-gamma-glutamate capsule biosynthesis protein CapA/YwtB (metallophosphatase superfamily)